MPTDRSFIKSEGKLLWPPYEIGQAIFIFALWFLCSSFFFLSLFLV